jgi:DHA1 family bicyclomycin/chloramphenicol resistance-like MFS transporter
MPNSTALALSRHPRQAGSASALLGTAQFVIAAGAAPLVGLRGGALSMAVVIATFAVAALATFLALARRAPTPVAVTGPAASQPIDVH